MSEIEGVHPRRGVRGHAVGAERACRAAAEDLSRRWDGATPRERAGLCRAFLYVHGCLTDPENAAILRRIVARLPGGATEDPPGGGRDDV